MTKKTVVGNCPRCGMPIYEAKDGPRKTCLCLPLTDAPYVTPYYPPSYPWNVPYYPGYPWYPYTIGTISVSASGGETTSVTRSDAAVPVTFT